MRSQGRDDPGRLFRYRDSVYAMDLLFCAITHLDFFTYMKGGLKGFRAICDGLGICSRPADVMLSLLMAMDLVEKVGDRYGLTDLAGKYLAGDSPDSLVPYFDSLRKRPQCLEFLEVLRTDKPAGWSSEEDGDSWLASMGDREFADSFTAAMDSRGNYFAGKLAGKLDLDRHRSLLDVAGGSGIYACAMADRCRHLNATVLELPTVDEISRRSVQSKGMSDRVSTIAGDMFDSLPKGHDLHLFANVFHDWDMDSLGRLAANSYSSLETGGSIVVFDAHLNHRKDGPLAVAEYSCLLMHSTPGRCYSIGEVGEVITDVGFVDLESMEVAAHRSVVVGRK